MLLKMSPELRWIEQSEDIMTNSLMDFNIIDAMTGEWQYPKQSTDMKCKLGQYYSTHNHATLDIKELSMGP